MARGGRQDDCRGEDHRVLPRRRCCAAARACAHRTAPPGRPWSRRRTRSGRRRTQQAHRERTAGRQLRKRPLRGPRRERHVHPASGALAASRDVEGDQVARARAGRRVPCARRASSRCGSGCPAGPTVPARSGCRCRPRPGAHPRAPRSRAPRHPASGRALPTLRPVGRRPACWPTARSSAVVVPEPMLVTYARAPPRLTATMCETSCAVGIAVTMPPESGSTTSRCCEPSVVTAIPIGREPCTTVRRVCGARSMRRSSRGCSRSTMLNVVPGRSRVP